ncbi:hypothetical protein AUJ15_04210 [Candidatus Micrarchaeota archaeon CG1_02_55_41]|nr:MAG: hypothetical protein AUJ15_04210 [Candidatus Micrarchaeota archaeon CG1_02_55_41]
MTEKIMEGSIAVAHAVARCSPDVVAAFPITPSTHIPQELSRIQPEYGFEFVPVEAEFSAISAVFGASAAGGRAFTATSSQGLLLMHEVLFAASGTRLPMVMVVANRAISAPLSIWNDWQDSISQRDAGWIQLYCKNSQETVDATIQAFKITEEARIPVMVCFDGFYLTHEISPIDVPEKKEIDAYAPKGKRDSLDVGDPKSFGCYATPAYYQDMKKEQDDALFASAGIIEKHAGKFAEKFGRPQFAFIEEYKNDKDAAIISMGSLAEEAELVADEGLAGVVRVKCFRPFPRDALKKALQGKKRVVILEKDVSFGLGGALATEVKSLLFEAGLAPEVTSIICGLGGKDVSVKNIKEALQEKGSAWM